jgi:hypothetical protein
MDKVLNLGLVGSGERKHLEIFGAVAWHIQATATSAIDSSQLVYFTFDLFFTVTQYGQSCINL